jgi:hypothetical protein
MSVKRLAEEPKVSKLLVALNATKTSTNATSTV